MRMAFDWNNITVKAKDVIGLCIGLVTAIWVAASINNNINNIGDDISEIRKAQQEFQKEYKDDREIINIRLNVVETDIKLLNQRVSNLPNVGK